MKIIHIKIDNRVIKYLGIFNGDFLQKIQYGSIAIYINNINIIEFAWVDEHSILEDFKTIYKYRFNKYSKYMLYIVAGQICAYSLYI